MCRLLEMHIPLTSGLSTVFNIDITPPTIACAVVILESPHHDMIALFCATSARPIHHNNWDSSSYNWNTATTHQCWHRPLPLGLQQYSLSTTARGPILTNHHWQERLQWLVNIGAISHGEEERGVLFSDESRFCISTVDGSVQVWRRKGEHYVDACVMERDSWGGQSIMVWGAITITHKAGPVIFQNIGRGRGNGVTAQWYISQVLRLHIVPYFGLHVPAGQYPHPHC